VHRDDIEIAGRFSDSIFNNLTLLLVPKAGVLGIIDVLGKVKSSLSIEGGARRADLYFTGDGFIIRG
jgi:hypothetical protein